MKLKCNTLWLRIILCGECEGLVMTCSDLRIEKRNVVKSLFRLTPSEG